MAWKVGDWTTCCGVRGFLGRNLHFFLAAADSGCCCSVACCRNEAVAAAAAVAAEVEVPVPVGEDQTGSVDSNDWMVTCHAKETFFGVLGRWLVVFFEE